MTDRETVLGEEVVPRTRRRDRRRRARQQEVPFNRDFLKKQPKTRIVPALLWSFIVSFLSVANPLLTGLAGNLQSQSLYSGLAMAAGQNPYGDFFATNGVLYYLMVWAGYLLQFPLLIAVLQFVALTIAGIYLYKIVAYFSKSPQVADQVTVWFYLFILAAGFGGLYASLFALPFLLTSIWFLIRYFENAVKDEAFILYGIDAALIFMIYPKSILLWVSATFVLLLFNIRQKRAARGIYQFLASVFGFLLIAYAVGYYTFEEQILGTAIQQTFLYNIGLDFTYTGLLETVLIVAAALLFSGFLKHFFSTIISLRNPSHRYIKTTILLAFMAQLAFVIGNQNFEISQLLILLPYGFLMSVFPLDDQPVADQETVEDAEGGETAPEKDRPFQYLTASWYLPVLVCLLIPLQPVLSYLQEGDLHQERLNVAHYIQGHSEETDTIVAWDNSAQLYLMSERHAATTVLTAEPYLNTDRNKRDMVYDMNKNQAKYVVVNKELSLLEDVKSNLDVSYTALDLGTNQLQVYQLNE